MRAGRKGGKKKEEKATSFGDSKDARLTAAIVHLEREMADRTLQPCTIIQRACSAGQRIMQTGVCLGSAASKWTWQSLFS
jgi:uncharacterized Fe-S radical SAM superfamily protein PflX